MTVFHAAGTSFNISMFSARPSQLHSANYGKTSPCSLLISLMKLLMIASLGEVVWTVSAVAYNLINWIQMTLAGLV